LKRTPESHKDHKGLSLTFEKISELAKKLEQNKQLFQKPTDYQNHNDCTRINELLIPEVKVISFSERYFTLLTTTNSFKLLLREKNENLK
jgi:hypothetical protein